MNFYPVLVSMATQHVMNYGWAIYNMESILDNNYNEEIYLEGVTCLAKNEKND